ncbi:MAG: site-specific DNA-methyltransferase [Candidatus Moranbacteria bacterium]|nr:site-specific DNA-methyltransferase [Candidatus Moranbacteria bacterium]
MIEKVAKASDDTQHEQLEQLRKVFPQFVKDGEIDFDAFKAFFESDGALAGMEKYGLSWAGKSNAFQAIRTRATGTLTPRLEESKNFEATENVFIEGDNLEVLKLLQKHYREKIKMIYIDPPYNTGKDFIYTDNFTENKSDYYERTGQSENGVKLTSNPESNGRYHSDWLTMMYPRLFLARNLLKDDGVIFVSIDDNEVANLRLIMDEIFGEENFVAQIIVQLNPRGRTLDRYFAKTHEYILVYVKDVETDAIYEIVKSAEKISEYNKEDEVGKYRLLELRNRNPVFNRSNRPNLFYPIYTNPKTKLVSLSKDDNFSVEILPLNSKGIEGCWTWGKNKVEENIGSLLAKEVNTKAWRVYRKDYLYGENGDLATTKEKALWIESEINNEYGKEVTRELFEGVSPFDFPKAVALIKKCIVAGTKDSDLILDFFAGSGTTAHAVMDLNAEDGGNRKWICVQIPETTAEESEAYKAGYKTIAEISRERIRRAGEKIGKGDIGFKAFALAKSNYTEWNVLTDQDDAEALKEQAKLFIDQPLVSGYDEQAVVYEILVKEGLDLNASVVRSVIPAQAGIQCWVVESDGKKLVVIFADKVTKDQVENLKLSPSDTFVCFDSALDDTTKINIARNLVMKVI